MLTTDFVNGSPRWVELGSDSPEGSADFYSRVFGWEIVSGGARLGDYLTLRLDGSYNAGIGSRILDDEPPAWTIYFQVDDIEESSRRVGELGGALQVEPTEVFELGSVAHATDPQGGWFALWQPGTFVGMEVVDRPGSLCWVELWTTSARDAKDFYRGLFGWESSDVSFPDGGTYTTVRPSGTGEDRHFGGLMEMLPEQLPQTEGSADWHPVFQAADCDALASRVRDAGGRVHMGPDDVPGVGKLAVCSDRFSAGFVILEPLNEHL